MQSSICIIAVQADMSAVTSCQVCTVSMPDAEGCLAALDQLLHDLLAPDLIATLHNFGVLFSVLLGVALLTRTCT